MIWDGALLVFGMIAVEDVLVMLEIPICNVYKIIFQLKSEKCR